MARIAQRATALLTAVVATAAVASIVQSQINFAQLSEMGAQVALTTRILTTLEDLARFGPVMAGMVAAALLPAFLLGHLATKAVRGSRIAVFAVAGIVGLWVAFWLMRSVIPMPALAATRGPWGHAMMALTGVVGGLIYAHMTSLRAEGVSDDRGTRRYVLIGASLLLIPAISFVVMMPRAGDTLLHANTSDYQVQTIATGLNRPWSVAFLPDGRMLITEMGGRLRAISSDGASRDIALDGLPDIFRQGGVIGLMEVALDPEFERNNLIYLTMGYGEPGEIGTRLMRARLVDHAIDDVRVLFNSTPKQSAGNNGGRIAFLRDDSLVLTLGDGSSRREEAQNVTNHLGALVRLDREGRPPRDNPFIGHAEAAPEIYSFGHRNPQGIAVDPASGELFITEHGPRGGDEVNRIVPGGNYGWPIVTGGIDYPFGRVTPFRRLDGYQAPVLEWTPSIAPAGLAIYQGALFPEWRGDLLVPALKERAVRRVSRKHGRISGQELLLSELNERMRDVKVGPDGAVYVLTDGVEGKLLRLIPPSASTDS